MASKFVELLGIKDMFKKYGYLDQEKLARIQILLSWMISEIYSSSFLWIYRLKIKRRYASQLFFTILENFFFYCKIPL